MSNLSNTEEFIEKAMKIHGNRYDYSSVEYIRAIRKVLIRCKQHGIFAQTPNGHLSGHGCPTCTRTHANDGRLYFCKNNFVSRAIGVHGAIYDYSLVEYNGARTKIKIICPIHGVFEQTPNSHLRGSGCGFCTGKFIHEAKKGNKESFIVNARQIHGDRYNYDLVDYYNARTKVKLVCPTHGIFEQAPHLHTRGEGCPQCKNSIGETKISRILEELGIKFNKEQTFDGCRKLRLLRFDFFLSEMNIIIEYHGSQHFKPWWNAQDILQLMNVKQNDEYKKRWAIENGYVFKEYTCYDTWSFIDSDIRKTVLS